MRQIRTLLLTLLFLFGAAWPCAAAEPLTIGASLALTGRFASIADALHKGFSLWERDVNTRNGILGRPVRVVIRDDQSDPDRAAAIYRSLIAEEKVDFLFAPYSSLITQAVLPIAEQYGIPMLIAGAAADTLWEQGYRNAIGIYTPASKFTLGFMELVVLHDLDRIVIVHADDPFSVSLANHAQKWAARFALDVLDVVAFNKGLTDLAPLAMAAKEKNAQVLMV